MRTKASGLLIAVSAVSMGLIMATVSPSFAQDNTSSGATSGGQGAVASGGNAFGGQEISPVGEYKEGLALGGWMFTPEIFLGAVYNTNANQLATNDNHGLEFAGLAAHHRLL